MISDKGLELANAVFSEHGSDWTAVLASGKPQNNGIFLIDAQSARRSTKRLSPEVPVLSRILSVLPFMPK